MNLKVLKKYLAPRSSADGVFDRLGPIGISAWQTATRERRRPAWSRGDVTIKAGKPFNFNSLTNQLLDLPVTEFSGGRLGSTPAVRDAITNEATTLLNLNGLENYLASL